MKISEFSVNRPVTTFMVLICVVVLGFISIQDLPLEFLPDISRPSLRVQVPYRSSSPQEVEQLITMPVEEELSTVSHVSTISSRSSADNASISLEFDDGTDMDIAAMEVRDRLDRARTILPSDVERLYIRRWQIADLPIMMISVGWSGNPNEFYDIVQNVIQMQLQRVEGVANVEIYGMDTKEIRVDLNQDHLKAYGVDVNRLSNAININNKNVPGGWVLSGGKKYTIRAIGEYKNIDEIAHTPVKGKDILLDDVAKVSYDYPEKTRFYHLDGKDAVMVRVYKASTANIVDISRKVHETLDEIRSREGYDKLNVRVRWDQSKDITSSLNNLARSGIIGGALAILMLFIFLRKLSSTIVISLAVPSSLIFTFFFIYLIRMKPFESATTLNLITMMAMVYAVGMVVDPSIVVLENIFRRKQRTNDSVIQAAIKGSSEVGMAVFAAVLTNVIVFLPLILMGQGSGGGHGRGNAMKFMGQFGIVFCVVSLASLFVALTIIPLMSSKLFKNIKPSNDTPLGSLNRAYQKLIKLTLKYRMLTIVLVLALLLGSFKIYNLIDRQMTPNASSRRVNFRVEFSRSFDIDKIRNVFGTIEHNLMENKKRLEIETVTTNFGVGRGRGGGIDIYLTDISDSKKSTEEISEEIKKELPEVVGVKYSVGRRHGMGGGNQGIEIDLIGRSSDVLEVFAEEVRNRINDIQGINDVENSLEQGEEEIKVAVNRDKIYKSGLSSQQVARTISSALSTRGASKFKAPNREIDINVQLREEDRLNLEQLKNLEFMNDEDNSANLGSIAEFTYDKGPRSIERNDRQSVVEVEANIDRGGMYSISKEIAKRMENFSLPPGYSWQMGRSFRMFQESESSSKFAIIFAVVLIYILLAALFESYIHPFTILLSVPFAFIGILLTFWATGTMLSQIAYIGIMIVCGLVVNNGIILIDYINKLRWDGTPRREAIIKGGARRLRPILMTAATTILGLLPLVIPLLVPGLFGNTEGRAAMWGPVGLAIFGGLLTSTFLTLIVLPTLYSLMDDFSIYIRKIFLRVRES